MIATLKVSRTLARGCPIPRGLPRVASHPVHHFRAQRGEQSEYLLSAAPFHSYKVNDFR